MLTTREVETVGNDAPEYRPARLTLPVLAGGKSFGGPHRLATRRPRTLEQTRLGHRWIISRVWESGFSMTSTGPGAMLTGVLVEDGLSLEPLMGTGFKGRGVERLMASGSQALPRAGQRPGLYPTEGRAHNVVSDFSIG